MDLHKLAHLLRINRGRILYQSDKTALHQRAKCGQVRTIPTRWKTKAVWLILGVGVGIALGLLAGCSTTSPPETPDTLRQYHAAAARSADAAGDTERARAHREAMGQ